MASVSFAPGDPKTPSYLRTKENGWNGSRYVGVPTSPTPPIQMPGPQQIDYEPQPRLDSGQPSWTAPTGDRWQTEASMGRYQAPPMQASGPFAGRPAPTNYSTATPRQDEGSGGIFSRIANRFGNQQPAQPPQQSFPYTPTDFGGGDPAQQAQQIGDARSMAPPPGFSKDKWQNPALGDSHKYTGSTIIGGGGSVGDILQNPQFAGWTQVGTDKVRSPQGNIYDAIYDEDNATGQRRPQWTLVGGPRWEAEQNNGFQGNYGGVTGYGTPGHPAPGTPGGPMAGRGAPMNYSGATGTGYGDPNADLFVNEVLSRLQALHTPINDPFMELLQKFGLDRVDDLGGDPYTGGEDAALRARYMDPLTQTRDTLRQQAMERASARGMLPSSGVLEDSMQEIDRGYQQGVARSNNDLAVRAIDEKQRRSDQQLDILGELLGVNRAARGEADARGREAVTTANLLPMMDERRTEQMLRASYSGGQQQQMLMSTLMQLMNQQQQQANYNQQNSQQDSQAWGQYLGYLLQNWDQIFG